MASLRLVISSPLTDSAVVDAYPLTQPAEFSLPAGTGAIALAREFTRRTLDARTYRGEHDDVVLVVSELVANAVRHGAGVPLLRLTADENAVRVEVADDSPVLPRTRTSGPDGGWGLKLVARIGADWGVSQQDRTKVVWCELAADVVPRPTVA